SVACTSTAPTRPAPTAESRTGAATHTSVAHARTGTERTSAPAANHAPSPATRKHAGTRRSTATCVAPPASTDAGTSAETNGSAGAGAPSPVVTQPVVAARHTSPSVPVAGRSAPPTSRPPASRAPASGPKTSAV